MNANQSMISTVKRRVAIGLALLAWAGISACNAKEAQKTESTKKLEIAYTKLADCQETVSNPNDAASVLLCPEQRAMEVEVTSIAPDNFYIELKNKDTELTSDLSEVSNGLPMAIGDVIEWHLDQKRPRFMVFRVSWGGVEEDPFNMQPYLTVHYISHSTICPLAVINVRKNSNANQMARDLIDNQFHGLSSCPEALIKL